MPGVSLSYQERCKLCKPRVRRLARNNDGRTVDMDMDMDMDMDGWAERCGGGRGG